MDNFMKPIIETYYSQLRTFFENEILKGVQSVGVQVDKERLLQALKDARAFWHEGYEVGRRGTPAWISVEERLPEDGEQVLACTKHGKAFSAHCENGKWRVSGSVKVTHWMPLPEPPEVEV